MNRAFNPLGPALPSPVGAGPTDIGAGPLPPIHTPTGEAGAPNLSTLITADARKVSGREFIDALGLSSPAEREARREQSRQRCIRAIKAGNTYGFPPALVAECLEIIDDEETGWNRIEL